MEKLFKAHLRKGRTGLIVVVIFITLAVFLMTVGLSILFKSNKFYDEKREELGSSDVTLYNSYSTLISEKMNETFIDKLSKIDYIEKFETVKPVFLNSGVRLTFNNGLTYNRMTFLNMEAETKFPLKITSSIPPKEGIPIYLTSFMEIKYKYSLGDELTFNVNGINHKAYIAGFYEHMINLYSGTMYTNTENIEIIAKWAAANQPPPEQAVVTYCHELNLKDYNFETVNKLNKDVASILAESRKEVLAQYPLLPPDMLEMIYTESYSNTIDTAISSTEPYILLIAVLLVVFSFVITIVALLILRFLIKTGIEDDIRNIGIFKALGYTTKELRLSYLGLYGILLGIGCIVGIIIALLIMPLVSEIITILANLRMTVSPNLLAAALSLILTIGICLLSVYISTKRLEKITPLCAIRGTDLVKKAKKNFIPLEKTKMKINSALSVKSIFNNKSQSIMIFVISFIMTFICAFTSVCYYNMSINKTAIVNISGMELYDVGLYFNEFTSVEKSNAIFNKIARSELIDEMCTEPYYEENFFINDDYGVSVGCSNDFSTLRSNSVYEGRYPDAENEVTLPGTISKNLNLKIGDTINVSRKGYSVNCTIVGLTQSLYYQSTLNMMLDTFCKLVPDNNVEFSMANRRIVYLKDSNDINEFINWAMKTVKYDDIKLKAYDQRANVEESVFSMIEPASKILLSIIITVTAFVVATVVFMIIRIKLIREKKNIAINKALGFTSLGITSQIGLSILYVTIPGVILGAILGGVLTPLMISFMGKFIGLMKLKFVAHYGLIAAVSVVILAVTYIISSLTALSTRSITPRMLVGK